MNCVDWQMFGVCAIYLGVIAFVAGLALFAYSLGGTLLAALWGGLAVVLFIMLWPLFRLIFKSKKPPDPA